MKTSLSVVKGVMCKSHQIWLINGPNLIGKSQLAKAIEGYWQRWYGTCDGDLWSQQGLSIKRTYRLPVLHHRITVGKYKGVIQRPGVITIFDYDQSHRDIAIKDTQKRKHIHTYIHTYLCVCVCARYNSQTRWKYKCYFIIFEIYQMEFVMYFCVFRLLNEIQREALMRWKSDPKGSKNENI